MRSCYYFWIALVASRGLFAACSEGFGLAGGSNETFPALYFVQSGGTFSEELLPPLSSGMVEKVAINGSGVGLIGGYAGVDGFVYYVYPNHSLFAIPLPAGISTVNYVDLNNPGLGLLGTTTTGIGAAYLVHPDLSISSELLGLGVGGQVLDVAISDAGIGLVGGADGGQAIAYHVYSNSTISSQLLPVIAGGQTIAVAVNGVGDGIVGGTDGVDAFAYFISAAGGVSPQLLTPVQSGDVASVDINSSGIALIGGSAGASTPFVYLAYPNGTISSQLIPNSYVGIINSVALNDSGQGLVGGTAGLDPSAYFIFPDGTVSAQLLPDLFGGSVNEVAISQFGEGLAFGDNGFDTFTYFLSPTKGVISLYPSWKGDLQSGSMIEALTQIITTCLTGNNLTLAEYINQYAPEKASYFLPALMNGSLALALESVAPTRNAASLFTLDNNLFLLNRGLSQHLRDQRHSRYLKEEKEQKEISVIDQIYGKQVFASLDLLGGSGQEKSGLDPIYTLWTEVIGSVSYQKAEHQTPGFDPITGGFILGFEATPYWDVYVGGGAAYTYTHIHQHRGSGHSDIDQEYLFAYGLFGKRHFYIDTAIWGGLFQTHQVRKIHMTAFDFQSVSDPRGWQLSPHLEIGGEIYPKQEWLVLEPFVMFDWANAWQKGYKEKGSGPFNMGQKDLYSSLLRSELGLRIYETIHCKEVDITFQEKASYVNKKPFQVGTLKAFLVGSPGSFTVETLSTTQNLGVAELAILFEPTDLGYPFGTIAYQGEFSIPYQAHQILLEVSWDF